MATKEFWKNASGDWESRTEWHRVVCFSRLAEYACTLAKGSHVMVQGSVRTREYENDGMKQRVFELRGDSIGKLGRAERKQEGDAERRTKTADPCRGTSSIHEVPLQFR